MKDDDNIKGRLQTFLRSQGVRNAEFCRMLGVSPAYINAMRKSLPEDKVVRICELFPNLNRDWLMYGEGEMLVERGRNIRELDEEEYWVPLLPARATAGSIQAYSDPVTLNQCERIRVPVKGIDFAIQISGDSMEPEFFHGDTLMIKRINERSYIPWGNPMVVDTNNGVMVKSIYPSQDDSSEYITAKSFNPRYPPFRIPTMDVIALYKVVGLMRLYSTI